MCSGTVGEDIDQCNRVHEMLSVLSGGNKGGLMSKVDEQHVLDIERECFMSLAGEPKTQARITHFLKTGKPLRN